MTTMPPSFYSADRVIHDAMMNAGTLQLGDSPNPDQYVAYMRRLNDIVNFEQTQGLKLFLQFDLAVPLHANQAKYVMSPTGGIVMSKPLRVISAYYLDSNGSQRPLTPLSWDEYERLSTKNVPGAINSYFVDKQASHLDVSFWLTPDAQAATGVAHLIIQQQAVNVVNLNDNVGFPVEWFLFLQWALADEICTGQPVSIVERCAARTISYRTALQDFDVEDTSTFIQPDSRSGYNTGKFT